jgi:hypothetical protein
LHDIGLKPSGADITSDKRYGTILLSHGQNLSKQKPTSESEDSRHTTHQKPQKGLRTTARCMVKTQKQKIATRNNPKQKQTEKPKEKIAGEKKIFELSIETSVHKTHKTAHD